MKNRLENSCEWQTIQKMGYFEVLEYVQNKLHISQINILTLIDVLWKEEFDLNIGTNEDKLLDEDYNFQEQIIYEMADFINSVATDRIDFLKKDLILWKKDVLRAIQFAHKVDREHLIKYNTNRIED